ncbi:hypothetical protein PG988_006072 [Apiospora saccharicola]
MAPAAGNTCSWYGTPASKKAKGEPASKKHKYEPVSKHSKEDEEDCAIEEGHSTPISVRELREAILLNKQAQQERLRARIPDPALHTVHGFVVEPRKAAAAAALAAPANHHRAAADSTSASMAEPSEVALADVNSIVRIHQAANQLAMQRNRLFNVVAADAAVANNTKPPAEARHVTFAPDVKPHHNPQPQPEKTRHITFAPDVKPPPNLSRSKRRRRQGRRHWHHQLPHHHSKSHPQCWRRRRRRPHDISVPIPRTWSARLPGPSPTVAPTSPPTAPGVPKRNPATDRATAQPPGVAATNGSCPICAGPAGGPTVGKVSP